MTPPSCSVHILARIRLPYLSDLTGITLFLALKSPSKNKQQQKNDQPGLANVASFAFSYQPLYCPLMI